MLVHRKSFSNDIDRDGLIDIDEIIIYRTDSKNSDTDDDFINDGDEIALGYDPNNPFSNPYIIPLILTILIITLSVIMLVIFFYRKRFIDDLYQDQYHAVDKLIKE